MRTMLGLALIGAPIGVAFAEGRTVTIENRTGGVIRGVYVSSIADDNWHRDRLVENIQAGDRRAIVLAGTDCRYDVRILLELRPEETLLFDVDVCRTPLLLVDATSGRHIRRQAK